MIMKKNKIMGVRLMIVATVVAIIIKIIKLLKNNNKINIY
jgi:hypothetical protein